MASSELIRPLVNAVFLLILFILMIMFRRWLKRREK